MGGFTMLAVHEYYDTIFQLQVKVKKPAFRRNDDQAVGLDPGRRTAGSGLIPWPWPEVGCNSRLLLQD